MALAVAPVSPSVAHRDTSDVQLIVTFTPSVPVSLTVVDIAGAEPRITHYLQLLDAAATRLAVYAADYRAAVEGDTDADADADAAATEGSIRR